MKSAKTMTIVMAMLFISMTAIQGVPDEKGTQGKSDLEVVCSPELESLTNILVSDYMNQNEGTLIQVRPVSDTEVYQSLGNGTLALVNKSCLAGMRGKDYFKQVLGRDAIVPVMNSKHPQRDLILENGISAERFGKIYTSGGSITWGEVLGLQDQQPVHAYAPYESCAKNYLADFIQADPSTLSGFKAMEPKEMLENIATDPRAIGFCSLACLMHMENSGIDAGIEFVPIDSDNSGSIEEFENIYGSVSRLSHSVFVGRFPKTLYSSVYALSQGQPEGAVETAFLEWVIGDGQDVLASAGIMELGYGERASGMEHLAGTSGVVSHVTAKASPARVFLLVGALLLLVGTLIYVLASLTGRRGMAPALQFQKRDASAAFPGGLFFDRSHTWAFMEKGGQVRIGIDDFLQNATGNVTRIVMKQPGEQVKRGEFFMTIIQNGKRLEIKSPVSGVVMEQNEDLLEDASLLNEDPFAEGWVMMVKPQNWISELNSYFMGEPYAAWLKKEVVRLKDFLTSALKLQDTKESALVLQDGGEIRNGVLESFGPAVWEEFQEDFINK